MEYISSLNGQVRGLSTFIRKRDTRMVAISTTTLRYLNEHEIYFLAKHAIPTLDTEMTLRLFQHSLIF